jgi:hypothetical protein
VSLDAATAEQQRRFAHSIAAFLSALVILISFELLAVSGFELCTDFNSGVNPSQM